MYKLVVLCALLAVAAAEPGALLAAPLAYTSTVISPATTSYSAHSSSVVHPSPYLYSPTYPGYAHFIKKRSPQFYGGYIAPAPYAAATTYLAPSYSYTSPIASSYVAHAPAVAYAASAAHFIKKRSAPLLPAVSTSYIAPSTYSAGYPYYTAPYATPIYTSTPYIASSFGYPSYFIKK